MLPAVLADRVGQIVQVCRGSRQRRSYDLSVYLVLHQAWFNELTLCPLLQTGMPMTGAAVLAGQRKMTSEQRAVLLRQHLPWAARAGSQCTDLLTLYYEEHLEENLDELRDRWRVITAPNTFNVVAKPIMVQTVSV